MKKQTNLFIAVAWLCACATANATSSALAEKYLRATRVPEMLQAQVEGYTEQYSKGQDAGYRKHVHDYLEKVMGWDALKDEYLSLVRETYTEQEINAFLQFMGTPHGRSMNVKNTAFASKIAAIAAKRVQAVAAERQASPEQDAREQQEIKSGDLSVIKIEKFQSGEQVYFTGEIKNNSKKIARGVNIEANLFLGEKFVDQYSTYLSGTIPAGGSRLFKISCGCKGSPPAEHDSFKLQVVAGY